MALALALEAKDELKNGDVILTLTLLVSLVSILGVAGSLGPIFKLLGVKKPENQKEKTTYEEVFYEETQNSARKMLPGINLDSCDFNTPDLGPSEKLERLEKIEEKEAENMETESPTFEEPKQSGEPAEQVEEKGVYNWCKESKKSLLRFDLEVIAPLFVSERGLERL